MVIGDCSLHKTAGVERVREDSRTRVSAVSMSPQTGFAA